MSNLKHTPGPWKIDEYGVLCSATPINGDFYPPIAIGSGYITASFTGNKETEMSRANTRLCVAAPEMLKVLIDTYEDIGDTDGSIAAVIEKATGMKIEEVLE